MELKRWNQRTPPHLPSLPASLAPHPPPHASPPPPRANQTVVRELKGVDGTSAPFVARTLSGTTPTHQAYPGVHHILSTLSTSLPSALVPPSCPKTTTGPPPASAPLPHPPFVSHTSLVPPHLPLPPARLPGPTPHTSQGKKGSVVGGCCSHCSLAPPPHFPTPPTRLCPPARPPAHPSAQIQKHPCLPFLGGYSQHSQSPNGWNRCTLRCFRTALKSFPGTCQPQENPLGPAKSTLCLKHLQCRQTSPPPFSWGSAARRQPLNNNDIFPCSPDSGTLLALLQMTPPTTQNTTQCLGFRVGCFTRKVAEAA